MPTKNENTRNGRKIRLVYGDSEYQFNVYSDAQRVLLETYLVRHNGFSEFELYTARGRQRCISRQSTRRRRLEVTFEDKAPLVLYVGNQDDLDILTVVVKACLSGGRREIKHFVQIDGNWLEREPGSMYRSSVVSQLVKMEPDNVALLLRFYEQYGPYLQRLVDMKKTDFLENFELV